MSAVKNFPPPGREETRRALGRVHTHRERRERAKGRDTGGEKSTERAQREREHTERVHGRESTHTHTHNRGTHTHARGSAAGQLIINSVHDRARGLWQMTADDRRGTAGRRSNTGDWECARVRACLRVGAEGSAASRCRAVSHCGLWCVDVVVCGCRGVVSGCSVNM